MKPFVWDGNIFSIGSYDYYKKEDLENSKYLFVTSKVVILTKVEEKWH